MKFTVIARAGLTQQEFGDMCNVSRVTVNMWNSGKMKPHRYIHRNVQYVVTTLEAALKAGTLPLAKGISKADRVRTYAQLATSAADAAS